MKLLPAPGCHFPGAIARAVVPRKYVITSLVAAGVFFAVYLVDRLMARAGLHGAATYLDNVLLALFAAALVFLIELQHERTLRRQRSRAAVISQMNHHIRNALQVITCTASVDVHSKELQAIHNAVDRIEWALREILPSVGTFNPETDEWPAQPSGVESEPAPESQKRGGDSR
jgi:hypothetical protein